MEVYASPFTCLDGSRTSSHAGTLILRNTMNDQLAACKATDVDDNVEPKSELLLQAGTQHDQWKKVKSSEGRAVHVMVVINDHKVNYGECRICHEDANRTQLDIPCACTGTLMYAHRKCVQRWCDEKGDTTCEICQQPYKSGYTVSQQSHLNIRTFMDFSDQVELHAEAEAEESSNMMVVAAVQRRFLDAVYEESNSSRATCFRSAALLFMALLLLHHATAVAASSTSTVQEDGSMLFSHLATMLHHGPCHKHASKAASTRGGWYARHVYKYRSGHHPSNWQVTRSGQSLKTQ